MISSAYKDDNRLNFRMYKFRNEEKESRFFLGDHWF